MSDRSPKTVWLASKLKQYGLDEQIYLSYLEIVLEGEDICEKINTLELILGEVVVSLMKIT